MNTHYLLIVAYEDMDIKDIAQQVEVHLNQYCRFQVGSIALFLDERGGDFMPFDNDLGFIIGTAFQRPEAGDYASSKSSSKGWSTTPALPEDMAKIYWGAYVSAFLGKDRMVRVMRDPSGALPCYYTYCDRYVAFASSITLFRLAHIFAPCVDWDGVSRFLYSAGLPMAQTAMSGVYELLPGTEIAISRGLGVTRAYWSPWDYAKPPCSCSPFDLADQLKDIVEYCVSMWSSQYSRTLLTVSGGLDSSIVAACLAAAAPQCLTMYTDDPAGDERIYARTLCNALGLDLIEKRYAVENVDITESVSQHLPRPVGRTHSLAYELALIDAGRGCEIDAYFTGNGGDNVFGYSQTADAVVDQFLMEGLHRGILRTVADVSKLTGAGLNAVLRAALKRLRSHSFAFTWRPDSRFLHPDVVSHQSKYELSHPWLEGLDDAMPGKASHIAGLLRVQQNLYPMRTTYAPVINPLLSQPIVELCLQIPSWYWCAGGQNRAVARLAFSKLLPGRILNRNSKGGPDGFSVQILRRYLPAIRERLLDGNLASRGILERVALEAMLASVGPNLGLEHVRIMELLNTEAWIANWSKFAA